MRFITFVHYCNKSLRVILKCVYKYQYKAFKGCRFRIRYRKFSVWNTWSKNSNKPPPRHFTTQTSLSIFCQLLWTFLCGGVCSSWNIWTILPQHWNRTKRFPKFISNYHWTTNEFPIVNPSITHVLCIESCL